MEHEVSHSMVNLAQASSQPPTAQRHPYLWFGHDADNEFWTGLDLNYYRPLYLAALKGDWKSGLKFLENNPGAETARITIHGRTALHVAAVEGHSEFIEKLVQRMSSEALAMEDTGKNTALYYAAMGGITKAAKALVTKNPALTQLANSAGFTPLLVACVAYTKTKEEMVRYLCLVTTDEPPGCPFTGPFAYLLIFHLAIFGYHDISLHLVKRYPTLATVTDQQHGANLLYVLATRPMDFPSGSSLAFWERCIYPFIPVDVNNTSMVSVRGDMKMPTTIKSRTYEVLQWLKRIIWKAVGLLGFNGIKKVYVTKLRHQCALQLVRLINEQVSHRNNWQVFEFFGNSSIMTVAAVYGTVEVIKECLLTFPDLIWVGSKINNNLLQVAIAVRQEKTFSLACEMIARNIILASVRSFGSEEKLLYIAAQLPPKRQLSSVSGAALQLQRELQWFKQVEKLASPTERIYEINGKTAREVFTEQHKELTKQGEKWMKDTSNSCMLVAALVATVVFAAAFTVPGGNKSDKGIPIFLDKTSFMVFAISDALALFSSSTAILMFLSILTARYAEEDFLESLPKRMIIGLASLFSAIATMMIAFGAAFSIVLEERIKWIAIPITVLGFFPVAMFVMLQLPLFIQMVQLTYGRSFRPQRIW